MNYNAWPSRKEKLGALFLDPKNPRLPKRNTPYLQNEIIEELVRNSDVREIASSIADDGYYPLEQLIIFKDPQDNKKYVLEGNRRLTACKLLRNPLLAPKDHQPYFKRLAKKVNKEGIIKLQILEAPDRESALKMLVRKHTKPTISDWKPIMKAHFYMQPLEDGLGTIEAAEVLGVTVGEIKDAKYLLQMYEAAKKLDLEEDVKNIVTNEYKFQLSTFDRVVGKPSGKNFLCVEQDEDGDVIVKVESIEFKKGLKRIVTDIATEKENSRTLNNESDREDYFKNRIDSSDKPDPTKKQKIKLTELLNNEINPIVKEPEEKPLPKPKPNPRPRKPAGLFLKTDLVCNLDNQRLKDIIEELTTLSPRKYPNAVAMSLRMLLELGTYEYLNKIGELQKWKDELKSKGKPDNKLKEWMPEMSTMLNRIITEKLVDDPPLLRNLDLIRKENSIKPILRSMNQFVHNSKWHPNEDKLIAIWKDLFPYLEFILQKFEATPANEA